MSTLIGTLLAVFIFSAVILVITKYVPIESNLNSTTGNTVVIYIATAALILINLYPFDSVTVLSYLVMAKMTLICSK